MPKRFEFYNFYAEIFVTITFWFIQGFHFYNYIFYQTYFFLIYNIISKRTIFIDHDILILDKKDKTRITPIG